MKLLLSFAKTHPNLAYIYAIVGNVTYVFIQILFKKAQFYLNTFQLIFLRSLLFISFNSYMLKRENLSAYIKSDEVLRLMLIRMAFMCVGTITMFYCLKHLPVSTVSTLYNTGPIFIFFIEKFSHNKPFNAINFTLTMLSFVGVVLIIRPSFLFGQSDGSQSFSNYDLFILLMLVAAFGSAMNKLYIHLLSKRVEATVNIQYSHIGFLFMSGMLINFDSKKLQWDAVTLQIVGLVVSIGFLGLISQYCIFASNTLKKPSLMMPFGYAGVATGYMADLFLFGGKFRLLSLLGILLASAGLFSQYLVNRGQEKNKEEENRMVGESTNERESVAKRSAKELNVGK